MTRPRRILVIGGLPSSLINFRGPLLEALVERGHEVHACAGGSAPEVADRLRDLGAEYTGIPLARTGRNPLGDARAYLAFLRLMRHLRPDVVLGYTVKPVIYGLLAARRAGVSERCAIITGLGYAFGSDGMRQRAVGSAVRRLYRWSLAGSRCVIFQNPDDRALFSELGILRNGARSAVVNGSGVDLDAFSDTPPSADPPTFLLIARLLRDKGVGEFVQAAEILKDRYPDARFQILGPLDPNPRGVSPDELQRWTRQGVVEYLGETQDVRPYLTAASVFVLPSYREGTPRTVLEAMAMGRPIVTTDTPGCRETVVEGRNGFLVPPRTVEPLVIAMQKFLDEPSLIARMGSESRLIAERKYDVQKVNRQILEALDL